MNILGLVVELYSDYAREVTITFCALIIICGVILIRPAGPRAQLVPSLSVSAGIFFTFLGLAISLVAVSNEGIDGAFNALLGGLSTAFWTSVVGMGFSMLSKFILAGRNIKSPLRNIQSEMASVRREISGLGEDISQHLTASITGAISDYSEAISSKMKESGEKVADLNTVYESALLRLSSGVEDLLVKVEGLIDPTTGVVGATQNLCHETESLLVKNAELLKIQKSWAEDIEASMASVAILAPEAKGVFEAVDTLGKSYLDCKENVGQVMEDNQVQFGANVSKITDEAINRMVGIESAQHERIVAHLESIDKVVSESFDVVSNTYGEGMVILAQKKLGVIAEIIEQLERARDSFNPVAGSEQSSNLSESRAVEESLVAEAGE